MLDEAGFIKRYDKNDVLGLVGELPVQLEEPLEVKGELDASRIRNVVVAAMGGSALAAEFVLDWVGEKLPVPVQISRGYELPGYVGKETLVVASSYSGTTEETLEALAKIKGRGAQIAVITGGGRLAEMALAEGWLSIALPKHAVPRLGALWGVQAWAGLLEALGWVEGLRGELKGSAERMRVGMVSWAPDRPAPENEAKQIAQELVGRPAVIYAGPAMRALALKWKIDLNEGARQLAFWNVVPELNHNEMSSWEHPRDPGLKVVELRSELEHKRVERRFEIMNQLLSNRFAPIELRAPSEGRLDQMLWMWLLGGYVSTYLGILNQSDPSELPLVTKLKERLS
jgi:glucose/mannose-6-phosphate isomerase